MQAAKIQAAQQRGRAQSQPQRFQNSQQRVSHRGKADGEIQQSQIQLYQNLENNETIDNYTYIPSQNNVISAPKIKDNGDNYTYIPSQNSKIKPKTEDDPNKRSYIPSQRAADIQKTWDNSGMTSVLERADRAEAKAVQILAGNFESM